MSGTLKCLICKQEMGLETHKSTSYYQCQADPTHRMSLSEYSCFVRTTISGEEAKAAMQDRARVLQKQVDDEKSSQ